MASYEDMRSHQWAGYKLCALSLAPPTQHNKSPDLLLSIPTEYHLVPAANDNEE